MGVSPYPTALDDLRDQLKRDRAEIDVLVLRRSMLRKLIKEITNEYLDICESLRVAEATRETTRELIGTVQKAERSVT